MTQIGEVALWVALILSLFGAVLAFAGGRRGRGDWVLSAERSVFAVLGLLVVAAASIIAAFVGNEYGYRYVAGYSNRELSLYYKITGLWAGQTGSLVFWALLLSLFASIVVWQNRRQNREFMPYVAGTLLVVLAFFMGVVIFASNPFELMDFTPADGRGLNPQLQNYWMTIHPPTLYLGFTAFTIPFAFAVSALLSGRLDTRWITTTRRWTLLAWFFLTNGIIFGMMWAYVELGWGGYWFWDPVENASLLPWLTGTAFLHSVMIQEKRGMLKLWNVLLILGTFLLSIFATFLTRSGLIESVHSFAQNLTISWIFLGFLSFLVISCGALVWWRRKAFLPENRLESAVSREGAFLLNNLVFIAAMLTVLWGTMFPLISEGLTGNKITVGPPFFNRVNIPLGLLLLGLLGIGPIIAWRKATARNLVRNFSAPVGVALAVAVVLFAMGVRHVQALLTFVLGAFTMTTIVVEFWKGTRARARIEGEGLALAFVHLMERNRRRYGGYVVHAGFVVMFMGFAGAAYDVEKQVSLRPGEQMRIGSPFGHEYTLTYQAMSAYPAPNMTKVIASVDVARNGRPAGVLTAEKRSYRQREEVASEVGIRRAWNEDLYLILAGIDDINGVVQGTNPRPIVTFRVLVQPLVPWIWIGGFIMALGTLVALWPGAEPARPNPVRQKVRAPERIAMTEAELVEA
ncbi:heme lyase CcmF/NrfE family subunit [Longimicrobium sp.]|uniref:heme lyase CcmF/NrfE family subunit n=1 Tax=Longimicrobium sp. TaxID=2029185 RepID=UPI002E353234|nr:heme lyase CcmF/NrfE family subunit [Longimicrobium sp.]HEX6041300.1 heme lyase CcmF/NrfE family subunit [Longimicrobium sp.]